MNFETDIALERLALAKGIELSKKGKRLVDRCPFATHDDVTAFTIDPKVNTWECEAGCGEGGVIEFVAKIEGISRRHAIELLKADFMPEPGSDIVRRSTRARLPTEFESGSADEVVLQQVLDFYHQTLKESPQALAYLHGRGLRDPDLLDHFHLGFADRTLGYRLPAKNRKAGAEIRGQLRRLGVLRGSGHERFRGSIVVPLYNAVGKVVQVYGRKITARLRAGTDHHVTLTEEAVGVLNPGGFVEGQKMILAGGIIDALTWWSSGFRNVTSAAGEGGLPRDVKTLLASKNIRSIWLALPRDRDAEILAAELRKMGIEVHQVVFPGSLDANEVARAADEPKEALGALLRAANWVSGPARPVWPEKPSVMAQSSALEAREPEADDHQVTFELGDRRWRIRGLENNTSHGSLRVNILVAKGDAAAFHVDVLELYSARHRRGFLKAAAEELDVDERVIKSDLGKVLLKLEDIQDERIRKALEPDTAKIPEMDEAERRAAVDFLKDPRLLDRILDAFDALGLVGERDNKLVAYLAATSRKLATPLAIVIQSSSAAGKSSLMDAVLKLFPGEEQMAFSAMTGRSLYYLGEQALSHKILSIAEEEGVGQASYALKILQSEGHLTIASTGKESRTGRLTTQTYEVSGPVALLMTTTAIDIDEELLSRCIVLSVDEGREQTRAIHAVQRRRKTLAGLTQANERDALIRLHHNAQRLLRPLHVIIPQAGDLTYADHALRTRRDHQKFLVLIQATVLLRQYQRDIKEADLAGVKVRYIEATEDDIQVASRLAHDVLGRTLDDLPPGTRKLLVALHGHVTEQAEAQGIDPGDYRFSRRQLREALSFGDTQLKVHLKRLVDMEFVVVHRGGEGRRIAYELVYQGEGQDGGRFLPGLAQPDGTIPSGRDSESDRSGSGRPPVGPRSGGGRGAQTGRKSRQGKASSGKRARGTQERSKGPLKSEAAGSRTDAPSR